ncbi:MAG: molecular chaperone DnaK, partial [Candidatus Hodgkinia cicadicola]
MLKVVGIDLGTTNSCVAITEGNSVKVIENQEGGRTTPSVVAITAGGEKLVGLAAKRQAVTNSENTFCAVKRLVGRRFDDVMVQKVKELVAYKIVKAENGDVWVEAHGKAYSPSQVLAMIVSKMKAAAEVHLSSEVSKAVITVPAHFNDAQRQATRDAGRIAGLEVMRIINEPTAAALAYGLGKRGVSTIVVYDLGGGTFDVSVLELGDGVFEVKSTNGDTFLGGEDFDARVVDYLVDQFKAETGIDLKADKLALWRLKDAAERAKVELSSASSTSINLPFIASNEAGPKHLTNSLTRAKLEILVDDLIQKTVQPCKSALADAGVSANAVNEVVLVGGMTRMPKVQSTVRDVFGKEPNRSVNPDEVVVAGAAIQAGVLQGDIRDVLLFDVTPLSLGIETSEGVFTRLIDKNTVIPAKKLLVFSTVEDGQSAVTIKVYQGERGTTCGDKLLGQLNLIDVPVGARRLPQIEVTFDIDADGMVRASARGGDSCREQQIAIKADGGLSDGEVKAMIEEVKADAEADKKRLDTAEARNQIEGLMYSAEKSLGDYGSRVLEQNRVDVEESIKAAKDVLADKNASVEDLRAKAERLMESSAKLGQSVCDVKTPAKAEEIKVETVAEATKAEVETVVKTEPVKAEVADGTAVKTEADVKVEEVADEVKEVAEEVKPVAEVKVETEAEVVKTEVEPVAEVKVETEAEVVKTEVEPVAEV